VLVSSGAAVPAFVISAFCRCFYCKTSVVALPDDTRLIVSVLLFINARLVTSANGLPYAGQPGEHNFFAFGTGNKCQIMHQVAQNDRVNYRYHDYPKLVSGATGLGANLIDYFGGRDFPVIFGIVWVLVIIVVLMKLAAELIEIAYNHFAGQTAAIKPTVAKPPAKTGIPKGCLIFSLGLCAFVILIAVFGPLLAPNAK